MGVWVGAVTMEYSTDLNYKWRCFFFYFWGNLSKYRLNKVNCILLLMNVYLEYRYILYLYLYSSAV